MKKSLLKYGVAAAAMGLTAGPVLADQQILDDLIVVGSICAGQDCNNGESFGFDTIRLKENNLRIKFQDTSTSASFPTVDWQLTANDSSNGGGNYFSIDSIDNGRKPFRVDSGAPTDALRVDSSGDVGLGTGTPVVELHIANGDSPTMRLEQNGSSGFTPQTWDVAGNEANFFVRDATNGSQLPFKIKPGADSDSLFIAADNDVGMGTSSPVGALHVRRAASFVTLRLEGTTAAPNTIADITFTDGGADGAMRFNIENSAANETDGFEMELNAAGDLQVDGGVTAGGDITTSGGFVSAGTPLNVPDYVFADDYELMPLYDVEAFIIENSHLPKIPSAESVKADGLNLTDMQLALLEKVEELTLHTIAQQKTIDALQEQLGSLAD